MPFHDITWTHFNQLRRAGFPRSDPLLHALSLRATSSLTISDVAAAMNVPLDELQQFLLADNMSTAQWHAIDRLRLFSHTVWTSADVVTCQLPEDSSMAQ